jgi:hypothetical protein
MRHPKPSILVLVTVAFVAALLGFFLSARASAGGPGFGDGPGMMGGGYGPSGGAATGQGRWAATTARRRRPRRPQARRC